MKTTRLHKAKEKQSQTNPFRKPLQTAIWRGVQRKLQLGRQDDRYEQEADRVADKVVHSSQPFFAPSMSRKNTPAPFNGLSEIPLAESITPVQRMQDEETVQSQPEQDEEEELLAGQEMEEEEEMVQAQTTEKEEKEEEEPQGQEEREEEEIVQGQEEEEEEELLQARGEQEQVKGQEEEEEEELLQAKSRSGQQNKTSTPFGNGAKPAGEAAPDSSFETRLKSAPEQGEKIDPSTRTQMEQGFGADFDKVHIHTGSRAVQMNKELGAAAFTHGKDIYFNEGNYNPSSREGKHLLAHELTHTIQQTGMAPLQVQMTVGDNRDLASARFAGNPVLEACLDNEQTLQAGSSGPAVSLVQQALVDAGFPLPRYGVDGIFQSETRSALIDFQRASSLSTDGVVGPSTMSALDGLFTGGAPALPPATPVVPTPTTPPVVTTETVRPAPDGTANTRTTVGVGERVRFTADTAGTWTVSNGRIIGINTGSNMVWEAPPTAASSTISITTPGGTRVLPFTVVAPDDLSMVVARNHAIPAGTAGACMITDVTVEPLNVNFGRTQWLEVPGPATNVSGYFNRFSAATIYHHPTAHYLPFNDINSGLNDHASWHSVPAPYSFGTFEWVIPNRYKIDGESDGQGRVFTHTTQAFYMFPSGSMMITKAGASVWRFLNNTVL